MKTKPSPGDPFPPVNDLPFRARIAEALLATEGVVLAPEAAGALASMITDRASDLITKRDSEGIVRIRPDRLRRHDVGDGEWVLELHCHPTFNVPWWHNTRVEHRWADKGAPHRPWPTPLTMATGSPTAALLTRFDSIAAMQAALGWANRTLAEENSDSKRGYSLEADLARNGQETPGAAILHAVAWSEGGANETVRYSLANVLGNSRAMARLKLLGLRWEEAVLGLRLATLRAARPGTEWVNEKTAADEHIIVAEPGEAWNRLMTVYEAAYNARLAGEPTPEGYERVGEAIDLEAAARLASASCGVVVGVSNPSRTLELVQKRNLRDHLRGNQDLDAEARYLAMGAEVIDSYARCRRIPPQHAPALIGAVPPDALAPGELRSAAEGQRRSRLVALMFPTDDADRRMVSAALGEPMSKKDLRQSDTELRARVLTALVSRGQLNSRVGEVFSVFHTKEGLALSGAPLPELVARAKASPTSAAADELLGFHTVVLLGEAGLYEAARGSSADRRQPANVQTALLRDRGRAIGLASELLAAQAEGRSPQQVRADGEVKVGTVATRDWFNGAFPKKASGTIPTQPATEPPPTPDQQLVEAKMVAAGRLATDFSEVVTKFDKDVGKIVSLCNEYQLRLDSDWVAEFNRECARVRNAISSANRQDDLVALEGQ